MLTWKGLIVAFACLLCGALPVEAKGKGSKSVLERPKAAVTAMHHRIASVPVEAKGKGSKSVLKKSKAVVRAMHRRIASVPVEAKGKGSKSVLKKSKAVVQAMQHGIASVYSHALTTKGGGSDHTMTAAHRTFPFGTRVKVTNLTNGRVVIVRINDRGPFIKGRVIDLNTAAARVLGISGLARVSLTRV